MTFRLRHEWRPGVALPDGGAAALGRVEVGALLATCGHCEALRVEDAAGVTFLRRCEDEAERVTRIEPPCLSPSPTFRAPW